MKLLNKYILKSRQKDGFGEHRHIAIKLLKQITSIFEEFDVKYCLISGTLLGHVRHADFIPWDDDIDLLVDNTLYDKINIIMDKYDDLNFSIKDKYMMKACFKSHGVPIKETQWNNCLINKSFSYKWPFIDLFVYTADDTQINFFDKCWNSLDFLPFEQVEFNKIITYIPKNPAVFLKINYGDNYMTTFVRYLYAHKY